MDTRQQLTKMLQTFVSSVSCVERLTRTSARRSRPARRTAARRCDRARRRGRESATELSFTPALRFSIDSNRSPAMPSATTVTPSAARNGERHDRQPPARRRRRRQAAPKTNPPTAPSIVFFGLIAGASGRRPNARPGVVLRGVADDDRQHQQEQRLAAARLANGDQRAERQPEVQRREEARGRRGPARRGRRARRSSVSAPSATRADISTTSTGSRHGPAQTPRTSASPRHRRAARARAGRWPERAPCIRSRPSTQKQLGDGEEQHRRREPDDRDGDDEENGAAEDASHLAPSATGPTGDGLMPPYRRSRFW